MINKEEEQRMSDYELASSIGVNVVDHWERENPKNPRLNLVYLATKSAMIGIQRGRELAQCPCP